MSRARRTPNFDERHISGAVFFDIEEIKDHRQEIGPDPGRILGHAICHSLEFGQDRHFLEVLSAEARPLDAPGCGAGALDADRVGWCCDHTERLIGGVAGHGVDNLQVVHGGGGRGTGG